MIGSNEKRAFHTTDPVDRRHTAVDAAADHHQQIVPVDPRGGLHAGQRAYGSAGSLGVDAAGPIGNAHVAHQVLVHRLDMRLHGALVAAQAGLLGT
ncbi:hypothetical protein RHOFW104T7_17615 [Rhodanobacter thiooxydans]|uniref:Uncharacterized protein n=1 Tax=Rhodanobacter thiooxydans TaxID=416169 RepID=A0A154QEE6_9GAMM|nr:hypothetical protein UUA_09391 [Rhodanobacter thiooxydans LCS2]KZC22628.1 hypothetical protein RHOFW104T7_17615 [Rhodanobacter thiooxydans]